VTTARPIDACDDRYDGFTIHDDLRTQVREISHMTT